MSIVMRKVTALLVALTMVVGMAVILPQNQSFAGSKPKVEDVEYDAEDREVSIDFYGRVKWKKAKVKIYDSNGKVYSKYIISRDSDDIEVKVKKLKIGKKYKYKIKGVKKAGSGGKYRTIKGSFYAYDD